MNNAAYLEAWAERTVAAEEIAKMRNRGFIPVAQGPRQHIVLNVFHRLDEIEEFYFYTELCRRSGQPMRACRRVVNYGWERGRRWGFFGSYQQPRFVAREGDWVVCREAMTILAEIRRRLSGSEENCVTASFTALRNATKRIRRPISELRPVRPTRRIVCQVSRPHECGKLARWVNTQRPVISNRQYGPFFYYFCGEHKHYSGVQSPPCPPAAGGKR